MSTNGEIAVQDFLKSFGFTVAKIPELPKQKTPDFLVKDETSQYIIEVKDKEDKKFMELLNDQISNEKPVGLEYDNRVSGVIRESVNQLDSYKKMEERFKILWFFLFDSNPRTTFSDLVSMQIGFTLYGIREFEGYTKNGRYFPQTGCFYFTYSDFYKHRQLDAVVIQGPNEIVLCMNEFSSRSKELRQTKIYQLFEREGLYIIEPSRMEKAGRCFITDDYNLDRKNSEAIANYIGSKYGLSKITICNYTVFRLPL